MLVLGPPELEIWSEVFSLPLDDDLSTVTLLPWMNLDFLLWRLLGSSLFSGFEISIDLVLLTEAADLDRCDEMG